MRRGYKVAKSLRGSLTLQLSAGNNIAQFGDHVWHVVGAHVVLSEAEGFPQSCGFSAVPAPVSWHLDTCTLGPTLLLGRWRLRPSSPSALDPSPRRDLWQKM